MTQASAARERSGAVTRDYLEGPDYLLRQGILRLLAIKDSDVRILTLEQSRDAVDKGLHAGGAFSAVVPLVALFYGGFISAGAADPVGIGNGLFVLSKGRRGGVGRLLRRTRILRRFAAQELALLREHLERTPRTGPTRHPSRHRAHGSRPRRRARLRARRPVSATIRRLRSAWRRRISGRPDLGSRDVFRRQEIGRSLHPGGSQSRPVGYCQPHGLPYAQSGGCLRFLRLEGAQCERHQIRWRLRGVGGFSPQSAQRPAHRDHLPLYQRTRRILRSSKPPQGRGNRRPGGAGDGIANCSARGPRCRIRGPSASA